jgi:hypothetical protein
LPVDRIADQRHHPDAFNVSKIDEAGMKIFISWSGERARAVAGKLHEQLPIILQAVDPWMSDEDLASGSHWSSEIAEQLDGSNYGIICVSPERLEAPWLNFEAGAIAKRFKNARIVPYLIGLSKSEITGPLKQYQAREATKEDTLTLLQDIAKLLQRPVAPTAIDSLFDPWWQSLSTVITAQLSAGQPASSESTTVRSTEDMIKELLLLARDNAREIAELRKFVTSELRVVGGDYSNSQSRHENQNILGVPVGVDQEAIQRMAQISLSYARTVYPEKIDRAAEHYIRELASLIATFGHSERKTLALIRRGINEHFEKQSP